MIDSFLLSNLTIFGIVDFGIY